ncbi:unnamed protein product [Acanthoscelides obtectus]|uniref:HTH psq-type domain-containing protein n=1 Tax=Acanthoscelides obtectus TaxID=200917 RepID=A0A9P0LSV7_ACAOB|nr:unnamed protein product [Acanthoscelides obtectus]CAK1651362.1 hypothetical protein AOBTE_LOCUS17221 [Acanthoscelides obtectus]
MEMSKSIRARAQEEKAKGKEGRYQKITFINIHAPSEDKVLDIKEIFHTELSGVYNNIPKYDLKIVMVNANAKIGREEVYRPTIEIYKGISWKSPDGNVVNEIDNVLVEMYEEKDIKNIRTYRGPDIDSDHYILGIKLEQRIPLVKHQKREKKKAVKTKIMPNKYIRKQSTPKRGSWSPRALSDAVDAVKNGDMGINEAAKAFGIPKTTFKRRLKANNTDKNDRLGPDCSLGSNAELKIVNHIKKLQKAGFSPTRTEVKIMAFNLAQRMGIPNKFNQKEGKAGQKWLELFLKRRPEISIRKSENTSIARALGMSRETVAHTTHYLQPLNRACFKTLKSNFYAECRFMVQNNPNRVLNRLQFGKLLGRAKSSPVSPNKSSIPDEVITPGKALDEIMPMPVLSAAVKRVRKKISGEITSEEFIKNKKDAQIKKSSKPVKKQKIRES